MRAVIRCASAVPLLAAAGCALPGPPSQQGFVSLAPGAVQGAGDPTQAAILNAAHLFGSPVSLDGRPTDAARAVARHEYPAPEIPSGARWGEFDPTGWPGTAGPRREAKAVLGTRCGRRAGSAARPGATGLTPYSAWPACRSCPPRTERPAGLPQSWTAWTGSGGGDGAGGGRGQRCRSTLPEGGPWR